MAKGELIVVSCRVFPFAVDYKRKRKLISIRIPMPLRFPLSFQGDQTGPASVPLSRTTLRSSAADVIVAAPSAVIDEVTPPLEPNKQARGFGRTSQPRLRFVERLVRPSRSQPCVARPFADPDDSIH